MSYEPMAVVLSHGQAVSTEGTGNGRARLSIYRMDEDPEGHLCGQQVLALNASSKQMEEELADEGVTDLVVAAAYGRSYERPEKTS